MKSEDNLTPIYSKDNFTLYNEDNIKVMQSMPDNSVDMVFADPPYFVAKADWDISKGFDKDLAFQERWIAESRRILKPEGTIWITGTHHSIYQCGYALQKLDFKILNDIAWHKPHPKKDVYSKVFVPSHETILWARKDKNVSHYFNHQAMNGEYFQPDQLRKAGERMPTVWSVLPRRPSECKQGTHPTQKPLALLRRIVLASTKPGDTIFDPFNGGGTTGIAVAMLGKRKYIGCDLSEKYIDLTVRRYERLKCYYHALPIKEKLNQSKESAKVNSREYELNTIRKEKQQDKRIER